jgi:hypothetical protein
MKIEVLLNGVAGPKRRTVELEPEGGGYRILLDGQAVNADAVVIAPYTISIILDAQSFEVHVAPSLDGKIKLQCGPHEFTAEIQDQRA